MSDLNSQPQADVLRKQIDKYIEHVQKGHAQFVAAEESMKTAVEQARVWGNAVPSGASIETLGVLNAYFQIYRNVAYKVFNQEFVASYNAAVKALDRAGYMELSEVASKTVMGFSQGIPHGEPTLSIVVYESDEKDILCERKIIIFHIMVDENNNVGLAKDLPYDYYLSAAIVPFTKGKTLVEEFNARGAAAESFTRSGDEMQPIVISYTPDSRGIKDIMINGYTQVRGEPVQPIPTNLAQFPVGKVRPKVSGLFDDEDLDGEDSAPGLGLH